MPPARILRIYLQPDELRRARDGGFNVMTRIKTGFEWAGYRVEFTRDSDENRLKALGRRGLALFHMQEPMNDRMLNLRRAYYYPFWRIERTNRRWEFDIAQARFDEEAAQTADPEWAGRWRKWLFANKAANPVAEGFVYVPLQGRVLEHRSFQAMSPLAMLEAVLRHVPSKPVVAGLHPGERYTPEERAALETLAEQHPRLSIVTGNAEEALRTCDFVVSQNSSVALSGFFYHKPAVLFARIDFHHIALNVSELGVVEAFARVPDHRPAYDAYLHWFIGQGSIKADEDDAADRFVARCRALGWDVPEE